ACGLPGVIIDCRELDREGPSFMVDTLNSLHRDFPDRSLLLFIGVDAFNGLSRWHRWRHLFDYAHVVVLTRPGYIIQLQDAFLRGRQADRITELAEQRAGKLFFQSITPLDISATAIRTMIAEKRDPRFLLPDAVLDYINSHHLYQHA
ncbi:MAG: nicotinate-nicotinamide nucleotide adenylyltransferase, partial [Gammaproteobacteria bacterium]